MKSTKQVLYYQRKNIITRKCPNCLIEYIVNDTSLNYHTKCERKTHLNKWS